MSSNVLAMVSGALFGLGLAVSQMINPDKVIGFLDVTGRWDPSLAFVLFAAVIVTGIGFRFISRQAQPIFSDAFHLPTRRDIDRRLIAGALIFGIGWGLAGYCPGPAIVAATIGHAEPYIFVAAMIAGSLIRIRSEAAVSM